jgi:NAD(P)-dependent dehydrogenase (short-subunit alcohol dehydrogenase family)
MESRPFVMRPIWGMAAGEEAPVGCPIVSVFATLLWRRAVSNKAIRRALMLRCSKFLLLVNRLFTLHWQFGGMAQNLFRLDGKIAFVSGSRGHLGAAMVQALAGAGAHVIVNGRDAAALESFAAGLRAQGFCVEAAAFDAHDGAKIRSFFGALPRLDVLVNNIGFMQGKAFDALTQQDFAATYAATVTSAFESVRAALPALRAGVAAAGDASVVNIASMYGQVAPDARLYDQRTQQSPFHYGPAKAGLIQLSRHLAAELGCEKIRVNALVPGAFPQPGKMPAGLEEKLAGKTMLGRIGQAEEIGGPLLFLASPASRYVTGASLNVDGGWTAW